MTTLEMLHLMLTFGESTFGNVIALMLWTCIVTLCFMFASWVHK